MSFEDERNAIESRFAANFTALAANRIKWENATFKEPNNGSWVALTILSGDAQQIDLGSPNALHRYVGIIQIDVFVPPDTGTAGARALADDIEPIFRNVQFSAGTSGTITTRAPSYRPIGLDGGWFHGVVSMAYYRDKSF